MNQIDFNNIRSYGGSRTSGFEELVCQIAHIERPANAKRFVRKEGTGGDAGVECYWILNDDSEMGWQAKYFPNGMNRSRWQQIDQSFSAALEKHPNLNHYFICLPLDKSDSRRKRRDGKPFVSFEDKWQEHVSKWKEKANLLNRDIKIHYWGRHEITQFLTTDNPSYSGRALYWFNTPCLHTDIFRMIAERSKDSLGARYTPELNIELPISKQLDGLCLNSSWWRLLLDKKSELHEAGLNLIPFLKKQEDSKELNIMEEQFNKTVNNLHNSIESSEFYTQLTDIKEELKKLSAICEGLKVENYSTINERNNKDKLCRITSDLLSFLEQDQVILSQKKSGLLYGVAGIGKSHLLCDLSLSRIKQNLPTLFLLGSQYCGGNPINLIKESLDLQNHGKSEVLGAIDAAGEASGGRALIIIDAINEGNYRNDWKEHIKKFLYDLSQFQYIAILFSCRSTYLNYILPDNLDLPRIEHIGFSGHEHRAAEKILSYHDISMPSVPILSPEFTNPLFLKICCQAIKNNNESSFPRGLNSISSLFDFYINSIERVVARKKKFSHHERIVESIVIDIASKLLPNQIEGIPKNEVRKLVNNYDPNPNTGCSLFDILIDEGIISEDISYRDDKRGKAIIRFTYERFSDYFITQKLIDEMNDIENTLYDKSAINELFNNNEYSSLAGILEALAIDVAEKFSVELEDFLPDTIKVNRSELNKIFRNSVVLRKPCSFSERTLEILNKLDRRSKIDILLKLSTEPDHPWNAEFIHKMLLTEKIASRDHLWSICIAIGDIPEGNSTYKSTIRTIIEWSHSGKIETAEKERIRLCAITLLWFLTTPNRKIRDQATKSLVRLLSYYPNFVKKLLYDFSQINDTYLTERLFAAAYGVVCNISDESIIREISETTYKLVFKGGKPVPHILLRDYARGIIECAIHRGIISHEDISEEISPPYKGGYELKKPSIEEIENSYRNDSQLRIKSSVMGDMGMSGDFGKYTMECVHYWSSKPLSSTYNDNDPVPFSKKWAQRWVCKQAYNNYGWSEQLFSEFDRFCSSVRYAGRNGEAMERVGKKYQWMAFHDFLARLSDNYYWINQRTNDTTGNQSYEGPWQIDERDIDPTIWISHYGDYNNDDKQDSWWQPYSFQFPDEYSDCIRDEFLSDKINLPEFPDLIQRTMPADKSRWLVLNGSCSQSKKYSNGRNSAVSFGITSILIYKKHYDILKQALKDEINRNEIFIPPLLGDLYPRCNGFLGEFPWYSSSCRNVSGYCKTNRYFGDTVFDHLIPFTEYEWENNKDYSLNHSLRFHMPAKKLIEDMNLIKPFGQWGAWQSEGKLAFIDPSLKDYGPSYALMQTEILRGWLENNGMEIIWLINGRKGIYLNSKYLIDCLYYIGLYRYEDDDITGKLHFNKVSNSSHKESEFRISSRKGQ